jgi:hypothetical protein
VVFPIGPGVLESLSEAHGWWYQNDQSRQKVTWMPANSRPSFRKWLRISGAILGWLILSAVSIWAIFALYLDFPTASLRVPLAAIYALYVLVAVYFLRRGWVKSLAIAGSFLIVLTWWLSLKPSNNRPWQPDVSQTAWAEIEGDRVTIHNVRDCSYRAEFDYTCQWESRTYDLSQIRGVDVFVTYWGSPWIAHPIVSFQFGDSEHIAFSIETRKEIGETYSAILGFFRQYELIETVADERDVIRLRTNYRHREDVYLYHTTAGPVWARSLFLEYLRQVNELREKPQWYNALTSNCTTNIFVNVDAADGSRHTPWDWRILLNGKGDEMEYEKGNFAGNLPFPELKARAYINPAAKAAGDSPDYSDRVREGRPGFENSQRDTRR